MNPGELWRLEDATVRLVLSHASFNVTSSGLVITAAVTEAPELFAPFAVETTFGVVRPERLLTHPRHWLTGRVGRLEDDAYDQVRWHLGFLFALPS